MIPVALAILTASSSIGIDRAEFVRRLTSLRDKETSAKVVELLGKPNDIIRESDPGGIEDGEIWCWGTNGHLTYPTLGTVTMINGKADVFVPVGRTTPSPSVISETELRTLLRKIHVPGLPRKPDFDSLWLVQAGNALIGAGESKAMAALREYDRLEGYTGPAYLWLLRTIFEVPVDPGYFPRAAVGSYFVPEDRVNSPRHPIILVDDVPFSIFNGAMLLGSPASLTEEANHFEKHYRMRTIKLLPPDDPFESYGQMIRSRFWPYPPFDPSAPSRFVVPYAEEEGWALRSLLQLVRTAYRPKETQGIGGGYLNGLDAEKFHKGFLATGAKWDPKREIYVPRDGKVLEDDLRTYAAVRVKLVTVALHASVRLQREDSGRVSWSMSCSATSGSHQVNLTFRNAESGATMATAGVLVLSEKQNGRPVYHSAGSSFDLGVGDSVVVEITYPSNGIMRKTVKP